MNPTVIILIVCVFFIIGGLYVYKMRDQEGDICTGDDPNAKYTLDEKLECRFATCAPGFEINENGTCVFIAEEEAKAELELAREELEVKKSALQQENLMNDEVKAQAVADLAAAEARLEDANEAIEEAEMGRKAAIEALEAIIVARDGPYMPRPRPPEVPPFTGRRRDFPKHWGPEPENQTKDYMELPGGYGFGSSTLAKWITKNMDADALAAAVEKMDEWWEKEARRRVVLG
jgi:hypothetical protein